MKERNYKCVICGKVFTGWGNNPEPVKHKGRCCDECNINVVVPMRIRLMEKQGHW